MKNAKCRMHNAFFFNHRVMPVQTGIQDLDSGLRRNDKARIVKNFNYLIAGGPAGAR
jgi:hypothetical protein